ncbi:MAG: TonB-dependent receptor [Acidobacteriaceae bacterium]
MFLSIALLVFTAPSYSQIAGTASVQGTITDATGAVIPNAAITLTNSATQVKRTATSNGSGLYSFPNIPVGTYSLSVRETGFQSYTQSNIVLEVGSSVAVNVKMTVGESSQKIEVRAEALALQTEDSSFKQTIDQKTVTEMPLNGRVMTSLITLSGGSAPAPGNDMVGSKNFATSVSISIAGGAGNETTYRLDGGDNMDYMTNVNLPFPFPDAVSEFSVESTALGAQGGQHPGGLVNVVTRSGTNTWHGSAFEFIRNNYIDATNFFSTTKDTLHQNEFGGTLGGKLIRNKLFFFVGYQHLKADSASASHIAYVPTPANLQGDFSVTDSSTCSKGATQLRNPLTGDLLPNNQISTSYFSATALALAKYLPQTTDQCGQVNYSIPSLQTENQFITREDWTISPKHSFYARYFLDGYTIPAYFSPTNILITSAAGNYERAQSLTLGETWTINSRTVNLFHATGMRRRDNRGPAPGINPNTIGVNVYAPTATMLRMEVSNKFNLYCGTCAPGYFNDNTFAFSDDVNMVRGKHQIVFGGEYIRNQLNISNSNLADGDFRFTGQYSQFGPTGSGTKGTTGADANLDLLTGAMSSFGQSIYSGNALRAPIPSLYAQDTYHATQRLVLTGGIRWVPEFEPVDVFNRGSVFSMSNFMSNTLSSVYPTAPAGILFYGDTGVPRAFTKNSLKQFSPNFGATYDPTGTGNTVFRGGWALVYDQPNFFTAQRVNQNPPFATATTNTAVGVPLSFTNPYSNGTITSNPYPQPQRPTAASAVFPNGSNYVSLPEQFRPSYTVQWTTSMQHQFGHGWQFEMQYIGNHSVHVALGLPINPAVFIPGTSTGPGSCAPLSTAPKAGQPCSTVGNQAARYALALANPAQGVKYSGGGSGSTFVADGATASYNGLVTSIQHRMSSTFSFLANYTWSKCLNIADAQGDIAQTKVENPNNIKMDWGPCGSDYRSMFYSTLVAMSHFGITGWKSMVFNNWEIAPLIQIRSGAPFNVTAGQDNSLTSIGNDRPNLIKPNDVYTHQGITQSASGNRYYIHPSAFSEIPASAFGTYGNIGRNSFRGPSYFNVDTALSRMFPVHERLTLDLRLEAFNVLNHPNFNPPASGLTSSTFGQITSQNGNARLFQGAIKFLF